MDKIGYDILVSVMLPGAMLTLAAWMISGHLLAPHELRAIVGSLAPNSALQTVALLLLTGFLGTALASLADLFEERILDRDQAARMNLSANDYLEQWLKYVDSLEDARNPKNSLRVLWMHFEMRSGLAGLALAFCHYFRRTEHDLRFSWASAAFFLIAWFASLGFVYLSSIHHRVLANYRQRRFGGLDALEFLGHVR